MPVTKVKPLTAAAIEQAWAVINAQREAEDAKKREGAQKLVGRFFKYHNSGGGDEKWWLYAMPTDVNEHGWLAGITFQRKSYNDGVEVELRGDLITLRNGPEGSGWTEIGTTEFWDAANAIRDEIVSRLTFKE